VEDDEEEGEGTKGDAGALIGPNASLATLLSATAQNRDSRQSCLEEERRLFFVAASRPRLSLTIAWPRKDRQAGQDFARSIFLADVPGIELWELTNPRSEATQSAASGGGAAGKSPPD
jgi:superfamily I DNA/RNA helicase